MNIAEFILQRVAEDEAAAKAAAQDTDGAGDVRGPRWNVITIPYEGIHVYQRPSGLDDEGGLTVITAHMQRHDPARVLAECEAKRRIVELFEEERERRDIYNRAYDQGLLTTNDDLRNRLASNAHCRGLEEAMLALALPFADHPDYDEEWTI